jgi:hypothetical protein
MMKWQTAIARFLGLTAAGEAADAPITRVSVLSSGKILVNGRPATSADVTRALVKAKAYRGGVWFFRETTGAQPPPEAVEVFRLIVEHKVPVSLSTKPDFSDFVDDQGIAHRRK